MPNAVLTLRCRFGQIEELSAELWERGTLGISEVELAGDQYELQAFFEAPFPAEAIPGYAGWHEAADVSGDEWQAAWQPVNAGERLWLAPHWIHAEPPAGRLRVNIHVGQGSGTSYSEPTLLMLEALETCLRPGDTVADIGTGSGILTAAAHALGAKRLLACDVDPVAAAEAAAALAADGIAAHIWCGSPRSLVPSSASLVLANLNAIQLEALAPELQRLAAPAGRLLLGGFTERNLDRLQTIFGSPKARFSRGPWRGLLYELAH